MSDWDELREQLSDAFTVLRDEDRRLLLVCRLTSGSWFVQVQPGARADGPSVDISVLVGTVDDGAAPDPALDELAVGRLVRVRRSLLVEGTLPLDRVDLKAARIAIEVLAGQALRVSWRLRPTADRLAG